MSITNALTSSNIHFTPQTSSPSQLNGLALWLRSDLDVSQSGGYVSQWNDQSGNGINVSQGTSANYPTYSATGGPNSTPTIGFPTSSHNLQSTSAVLTQGSNRTVFVIGTPGDPVSGKTYCASIGFNLSSPYCILSCSSSSTAGVNEVWNDGVGTYNITDTYSVKTPTLIQWNYSIGQNIQFYENGNIQNISYDAPCTTDVGGSSGVSIGGFSNIWSGTMSEIIVYNHICSTGEQNLIKQYVNQRYALGI